MATEVMRWNPFREMNRMRDEMDQMMNTIVPGIASELSLGRGTWNPAVNIAETDDNYTITAELPGFNKNDFKVTYDNGFLSIRGERKKEKEDKGKEWHRIESYYGSFERSFYLPMPVKSEKIDAQYKDGILTLTLPKIEEKKPKNIEVKVSE